MKLIDISPQNDTHIVNEYINDMVCRSNQLSEGLITEAAFKDFLVQNAQKLKKSLSQVKKPLDALNDIQGKVWVKLQTSNVSKEDRAKLVQFAKKHAKLVKPAIIVAVIGASLLGMDASQASEIVNNLDNIPSDQIEQLLDPVSDVMDASNPADDVKDIQSFIGKFYNKMKEWYDAGHNNITVNGKVLSFEDAVKSAEQRTSFSAKDYIEYMAKEDVSPQYARNDFFRWIHDIKSPNKGPRN